MNADVQSRFDRLDAALNTLIDSLTSYNPSPTAAVSLLSADDDLTIGLEQLSSHQRNFLRIQALRSTAVSLDDKLKSALVQLADTHKQLIVSSPLSEANILRQVDHDQLLSYAQQIARFTVPPTYRPLLPPSIDAPASLQSPIDDGSHSAVLTVQSSAHAPNSSDEGLARPPGDNSLPLPQLDPSHLATGLGAEGRAVDALPLAVKAWLEPPSVNMPFMPWPEEDNIRRGALGLIEESWGKAFDPSQRNIAGEADAAQMAYVA